MKKNLANAPAGLIRLSILRCSPPSLILTLLHPICHLPSSPSPSAPSETAAGNVLLTAGVVTVKYNGIKVSLQVVSSFSSSSTLKFSQRATKSTNSGGNQYKRDHYMWQAALPDLRKRRKRIIIIILLLYPKKQHFTSFSCARLCVTISSKTYLCLSR